jgi:protein-L-isoaspartate(D-aspartate) O-methyltransferase
VAFGCGKMAVTGIDFQAQRIKMVDGQLRTTDVTGHALLNAFLEVPREIFVPETKRELAYIDADIEVAPGRFLMEASPLAKLISLAEVKDGEKVLLIGSDTGYAAAIVSKLAAHVVAVESDADLAAKASSNLSAIGVSNAEIVTGPLQNGQAKSGPYDVILFSGSVDTAPSGLFSQLKDGGRLAVVETKGALGAARLHVKRGADVSGRFGFNAMVRPLPGFAKQPEFSF